jgi:DNA polymerase-1
MLTVEELLELNRDTGHTLATIHANPSPLVKAAVKGVVNARVVRTLQRLADYLASHTKVEYVTAGRSLAGVVARLKRAERLGLDIETAKAAEHPLAGLLPQVSRIRLVQLSTGPETYVVDADAVGGVEWLRELAGVRMVAHNAQFEDHHLAHAGIALEKLDCTMLMGRVFLNVHRLGLMEMAGDFLDIEIDKSLQVSDWSREQLLEEQIAYAAMDAVLVLALEDRLATWFTQHPHYRTTYEFLRSLIRPASRQMLTGIRLDVDAHAKLVGEWGVQLEEVRVQLARDGLAKPGAVKATQAYIEAKLSPEELAGWPRTPKGGLKTDMGTLEEFAISGPMKLLGDYNRLTSWSGNYGTKLRDLAVDGVLYPSYRVAGMITGRWKCTSPNVQNQPREKFKHVFTTPPGKVFVSSDLAQVELRVAGLVSGEPAIVGAYARGEDLHTNMAMEMRARMGPEVAKRYLEDAGGDEAVLMKRLRQGAKGVNFGLIFGSGWKGLQRFARATYHIEFTDDEARAFHEIFHDKYPVLSEWQRLIVQHSRKHEEVETPFSRLTRHFVDADYYRDGVRADGPYSVCMNHPVQGGAAEILNLAIVQLDARLPAIGGAISHHVYDELTLLVPEHEKEVAAQMLYDAFAHGYRTVFPGCSVKGISEVGWGRTWAECSRPENVLHVKEAE